MPEDVGKIAGIVGRLTLLCGVLLLFAVGSVQATTVYAVPGANDPVVLIDNFSVPGGEMPVAAACGDHVVAAPEECDDGNTVDGDGCSAQCEAEFCGDAMIQAGLGEICDDGNMVRGDGCSEACLIEAMPCDADANGKIDIADIRLIFAARGTKVTGDDPRDANKNGRITISDGRICVLLCTNPQCAP